MARIADDSDFDALKRLVDDHRGWTLELAKSDTQVYTRQVDGCNFKMVKIHTEFLDVTADTLFDVLHDPDYRKVWDSHMLASEEIGILNVNNDVGYYANWYGRPRDVCRLGNAFIVTHARHSIHYPRDLETCAG
ncbi:START domain-containing protein 10-like [Uranotaenia lowii]|uniref:START domain-containing protein 10-like n=1 Tax=Uranotaenia lowii TaxID=190385 RepID=UPI00247A80F4|nr:START domain-containing protein 10-like [Uranotaenia lowii]